MNTTDIPKIIALYLPQYHPFKENDEWWGKGFTEWTNVAKAKPLYRNHYQPKIPADLGFYDLRVPEVREQQAQLAREAGIYGFCYWHYWFGNGKQLMESVFDEVLESGEPDFPFCLAWANHSWYAKLWNKDDTNKDKLLIEQTYPQGDPDLHYSKLRHAFHDKRYIKVGSSPLFMIYDPMSCPKEYLDRLQELARADGFPDGLFIVGNITLRKLKKEDLLKYGYSAVTYQRLTKDINRSLGARIALKIKTVLLDKIIHRPAIADYRKAISYLIDPDIDGADDVFPGILPNWDHTPRSGLRGSVFEHATPSNFKKLAKKALEVVRKKPIDRQIIFLKSWNEWGEGNYMEPDLKYGKGFINALREALDEYED